MKLKAYFDEFIAITIVFFLILTFTFAAQVQGQEASERIKEKIEENLSEPLEEGVAPADPVTPTLTAVETPTKVVLNPGQQPEQLVQRTDAVPAVPVVQVETNTPVATTVIAEDRKRIVALRDNLGVVRTDLGQKISLESDILFDFDKSVVKTTAYETLGEVAEFIRLSGDNEVEIVGYADPIGNENYNLDLSWKRANAVIDHLVTQENVPKTQLRAVGRGEEGAEAPNTNPDGTDNPEGRQENRRVEILIRDEIDASAEKPGPELN